MSDQISPVVKLVVHFADGRTAELACRGEAELLADFAILDQALDSYVGRCFPGLPWVFSSPPEDPAEQAAELAELERFRKEAPELVRRDLQQQFPFPGSMLSGQAHAEGGRRRKLKPLPKVGEHFTWTRDGRVMIFERLPDEPDPYSSMAMRVRVLSNSDGGVNAAVYQFHVEPEWFRQRGYAGEAPDSEKSSGRG